MKTDWEEYGAQCGTGWRHLYHPLVEEVTKLGGKVLQVKEKFGGLRFYYSLPKDVDKDTASLLDSRVGAAEAASFVTCEECGKPGKRVGITTLCTVHAKKFGRR